MNPELPHDVVVLILAKLPLKTLLCLRTVCSLWCNTIESVHFSKLQLSHGYGKEDYVLMKDFESVNFYVGDLNSVDGLSAVHEMEPGFKITGTRFLRIYPCNGVLLVVDDKKLKMVLWNPSTGKFKKVPSPRKKWSSFSCFYGVWYDSVSGGFRILSILNHRELWVFDSKKWKKIRAFHRNNYIGADQIQSKAFIHGGFHLLCYYFNTTRCGILSLNQDGNEIRQLEAPPALIKRKKRYYDDVADKPYRVWDGRLWRKYASDLDIATMVWDGRLCLKAYDMRTGSFEVWSMDRYGDAESWNQVLSIGRSWEDSGYYPYSLLQNGGRRLLALNSGTDICVHDYDSDRMSRIRARTSNNYFFVDTYVPSLLNP